MKTLYVSQQLHQDIIAGRLAIARLDDKYVLLPLVVADKIRQRDASYIIDTVDSEKVSDSDTEADDPYADYPIPDDLMW